jgi:cellulose synthase/poly-beta-1,6-N-acetylglucosamine synthase-like glycosyltransferase
VQPAISVCIVTARRHDALDTCLQSLAAQEDPPPFELLVVSSGDPDVAAIVHRRFPAATVAEVPRALPGAARNVLLGRASGGLLLFLDDDVTVRTDLLRTLADVAAAHPDAVVFGGPNETPRASSRFQWVQGAVLASMVGSGPVRRRYGRHTAGPADERFFTLCNLAVRRSVMPEFLPDQVCAEENAVLAHLHAQGLRMHYDPTLVAYHDRRPDWRGFARQMHKYGLGRGQLMARRPATVRLPYLAPSLMLAYLVAAVVALVAAGLAGAGARTFALLLAPGALYVVALAAGAIRVALSLGSRRVVGLAFVMLAVLHACYGWGVVQGVAKRFPAAATPRPTWVDNAESVG